MREAFITLIILIVAMILFELSRILYLSLLAKKMGRMVEPFSREIPGANKKILIIGDSTSFGTGATHKVNSLAGRLSQKFPDASIYNASINAMKIKTLREKIGDFSDKKFDLIFIHIGGMDVINLTSEKSLRKDLKEIFRIAKNMAPKIYLISMNNVGALPAFRMPLLSHFFEARTRKIKIIIDKICKEEGNSHISLFYERKDDPLLKDQRKFISKDGIHPTDDGYGIWHDKIMNVISSKLTS